jgi:peptide/nickel transport system permease protein
MPVLIRRFLESDIGYSFRSSPVAWVSFCATAIFLIAALFSNLIAPHDPFDLARLVLSDARLPPVWSEDGRWEYLLGTDDQGRDMLSAILYGLRISLVVSLISVLLSVLIGITLGLLAGYLGGWLDAVLMRMCDVMLSFPSILIALLIAGVGRALFPQAPEMLAFGVLVLSITLPGWVQYARTVRASALVEAKKEYVLAARLIGVSSARIVYRHILPNVLGPILVLATIQIATSIITEATLSFLGVGVPPTSPSLGTLIRIGNDYLFSGEWWIIVFPGLALVGLAVSVNLLGDWMRDAFNPRLRVGR